VAAINQNGTLNSGVSPAARGSIVTIYATGEGQTETLGIDGKPASAPFPKPGCRLSVRGGYAAEILFAGEAPDTPVYCRSTHVCPAVLLPRAMCVVLVIGTASSGRA